MPNQILKIKDFTASASDAFLFDNNVWMYLFCPLSQYNFGRQKEYSRLLQNIISRKLPIFINSTILSEFANRYLRLDFEIARNTAAGALQFPKYKPDYLRSTRGMQTIETVKTALQQIVNLCQRSSDEFNSIDFNDVLHNFVLTGFNDAYYSVLCAKKKWIIVTDDSDFTANILPDRGLRILTA